MPVSASVSRGASLAISISAAVMIRATTDYLGPFAVGSINARLLDIQTHFAVT